MSMQDPIADMLTRASAVLATGVFPNLELVGPFAFDNQTFLSHKNLSPRALFPKGNFQHS